VESLISLCHGYERNLYWVYGWQAPDDVSWLGAFQNALHKKIKLNIFCCGRLVVGHWTELQMLFHGRKEEWKALWVELLMGHF
jgi:hypothetical protein